MDPEVSVLLHCAQWGGLRQSQVEAELSDRFNRQTDGELQRYIEEVWRERVVKEPWLFNGAKFRLHSFCLAHPKWRQRMCCPPTPRQTSAGSAGDDPEGGKRRRETSPDRGFAEVDVRHNNSITCSNQQESECECETTHMPVHPPFTCAEAITPGPSHTGTRNSEAVLTLHLGLTCYKDFLGTNWSHRATGLRERGEAEFSNPMAFLAQPLGVGAVMCTCDQQVVFIRRSRKVAEAAERLDIPGGHPEPKVVCEGLGQLVSEEEQISLAELQQRPDAVISELFSSVRSEIRDEVNVPLNSLGEPVLLGVALNHTSCGRPSAEFLVSCSLSSDDVRMLYWEGGVEAHESTDIFFLSRTELLQLDSGSPLWTELCPSAKGAVLLYQLVMAEGREKTQTHTKS